jgi:UDP-glucuronate 4-epimerase
MRVAVTGAAGFVGSHLAEAALRAGDDVVGIDCLTDHYSPALKRRNLEPLLRTRGFEFIEADLQTADLEALLEGADVVYHLAGQASVRWSWAHGFVDYVGRNVLATQRLLEAVSTTRPKRLVYASSSSIYGNAVKYPTDETALPQPHSPYGVTKLAGEHLCGLYAANGRVQATILRYFTVYGPRQRPDMGIHRFLSAAIAGQPLPIFGDGEQVRDFTFVGDIVAATLRAGRTDLTPGTILNVAGGSSVTVNVLVAMLEAITGRQLDVERLPEQPGDVRATGGSIDRARELLGWEPAVGLFHGLSAHHAWLLEQELAPVQPVAGTHAGR